MREPRHVGGPDVEAVEDVGGVEDGQSVRFALLAQKGEQIRRALSRRDRWSPRRAAGARSAQQAEQDLNAATLAVGDPTDEACQRDCE